MKDYFLAGIATVALAALVGLTVYASRYDDFCPQPSAVSVTALFAPCQTFDTAMGHTVTKQEAMQMGLLKPTDQPASIPAGPPVPTPAQLVADDFQIMAQEHATVGVAPH
jgi:hypothetical protein